MWTGDLPDVATAATHDDVVGQCWMVNYAPLRTSRAPGIQSVRLSSPIGRYLSVPGYHHCPFGLLPVGACERPRLSLPLWPSTWCALECDRQTDTMKKLLYHTRRCAVHALPLSPHSNPYPRSPSFWSRSGSAILDCGLRLLNDTW